RSITVNMAAMAGPSRARWFDPTTGTYVAIDSGWTSPNSGTRTFVTPGFHNDSTDDWVLVIDTGTTPNCGTIHQTGSYTAPSAMPAVGVTCTVVATSASTSPARYSTPVTVT